MKHFTYDDRLVIQRGLTLGWNFSRIAAEIGKDRTSVSREIRAHLRFADAAPETQEGPDPGIERPASPWGSAGERHLSAARLSQRLNCRGAEPMLKQPAHP